MARCLHCSAEIPEHSSFCLACGATLMLTPEEPTIAMAPASSESTDEGRFASGASPLTTAFSAWYANPTIFLVIVVLALTGYAFHTAVAGRPLFKAGFLEPD